MKILTLMFSKSNKMLAKFLCQTCHLLMLVYFLHYRKGLGMPPQHGLLTPVSETVKVDAHICSGEDGHSKHRASENIVRLFRPSWKPKRLLKKNLDRRLCMGDWFVYYVRVHKKDANYLRIRVSQWAWKTIQLTPWRKYSVVKLRRGSSDMLKNERLSKNEKLSVEKNLSKNEGKFSNKKNFKGERFLIWSKRKEFNQTSFKRLGDIKFELLNKQTLRLPRQYFQKVSQMCGKLEWPFKPPLFTFMHK